MNQRDVWDFVAIIAPLLLSVVAVYISVRTTKKQNKIALFEKRYSCFFPIRVILNFAETITDTPNKKVVLGLFDAFWGTSVSRMSGDRQTIEAKTQLETIKKDIVQAPYLYKHKFVVMPIDILCKFHEVILCAIGDKELDAPINEFISVCKDFKVKDLKQIEKSIKL
jgi:hypothetical protein